MRRIRVTGWRLSVAAAVAGFALVAACGDDSGGTVATFTGTDGAVLYQAACGSCHGTELLGTDQGPPFLDAIYRPGHHSDAAFFLAVKGGARSHHWNFGNMPPVAGLDDAQIEAIVTFVRQQQQSAGIE